MCGIAGIAGPNANLPTLNAMLEVQAHRGPDNTGVFLDEGHIALGHNRLAIIDLTPDSHQPMVDPTGRYAISFNGAIYNYLELKAELRHAYDFRTASDTEVLLAAYINFGKACLPKLRGMFSFAIWDRQEKTLFAARDRFGVKPFYYSLRRDACYFASEIKSLFQAGVPKRANADVWAQFFAYGHYGMPHESFWSGVQQLPGAHYLEWRAGRQTPVVTPWYDFATAVSKHGQRLDAAEVRETYLNLMQESIKLRFRADVPVGFNLSGGLDSSALLALVNQFADKANIQAYSFYTNHEAYDELPWVEAMLAHTHNPLTKVLLSPEQVPDLCRRIAWHQDEPFGGVPTLAYAEIFRQARQDGVIVLLDGQGMDEQWAGYDYYLPGHTAVIQGVAASPFKTQALAPAFLSNCSPPTYPQLFGDDVQNKQYRDLFYTKIPRALRFNDRVSMAYATELREPFLDHALVEFAFAQPLHYKIKDGVRKYLLREIVSTLLSDDLAFAPKRALQTPQREWLGNELRAFVEEQINKIPQTEYGEWFDMPALRREWRHYLAGDNQSSFHIWQWISLPLLMP